MNFRRVPIEFPSMEAIHGLYDSVLDGSCVVDSQGCFKAISPTYCTLIGYQREELLTMSIWDLGVINTGEKSINLEEIISSGKTFIEITKRRKDGKLVKAEVDITPLKTKDEQLFLIFVRNITNRKQKEKKVKQNFAKLRSALEGVVQALSSTIEIRDPYIKEHQQRVTKLACAIAKEFLLPEEDIEEINLAGALHDIGRINVPIEITSKPNPIQEHEFDMVKSHVQVSYSILSKIEYLSSVAQIILQHHERLDGSGYPAGIKGDEIILPARILAVADVVEAMISRRPYRQAHTIKETLEEISRKKGVFYDSRVVDACIKLFTEKGFNLD